MNLVQLKKKLITVLGNSISIHKGANAKFIRKKQIFSKSKINFLISDGEKDDEKAFFLAISSKRVALFHLKNESPIAVFKLDEKIVDHGTVKVLDMGMKKEGEFRVKLIIPIAFASGTVRKMRLTVHFDGSQRSQQKMNCLEEMRIECENENMRFCVDLGSDNFFGFFEDTVVKSDGLVTRAKEPSTKKKRRIAVVGKELWQGNILLATENGTIRVVRVKDENENESNSVVIFSEGQCVPPYCSLRCREPSVIISTENTVIVGTQRGEIHFLNEQLELKCKINTEGGSINCLKVNENDADFLWVEFESGELRMLFMPDSEQNDEVAETSATKPKSDPDTNGSQYSKLTRGKKSETEMMCMEKGCHYKTRVADTFASHLRRVHRTNLTLAGLALRCQCGIDSLSETHSRTCSISNFTVIRTNEFGPARTYADEKITPQCTMCEIFPKTIHGYVRHLYDKHDTTIDKMKYFLKCGVCDGDVYNSTESQKHSKKCKSRFYSLHNLDEDEEKNDETEMDQTADT